MNGSIILAIGIGALLMVFFGSFKSNSDKNEEYINEICERIKKCPTTDEVIEKIKKSNIGVLSIGYVTNYSGPYYSYCYYKTTSLKLDGNKEIISYSEDKFYEIYNKMITELKNYNIQLINSETIRFNKIY